MPVSGIYNIDTLILFQWLTNAIYSFVISLSCSDLVVQFSSTGIGTSTFKPGYFQQCTFDLFDYCFLFFY